MKKIVFLFFFTALCFAQQPTFSLKKLWSEDYNPERLESIRSMKNGNQYTALEKVDSSQTSIKRYDFGKPNDAVTLFSTSDYSEINTFSGYSFSKNEEKILLETATDQIYRRSKQAIYWIFDMRTKDLQKVSDAKIQEPLFSPDGSKVAYVYRRNLFIKELVTNNVIQITFDGDYKTISGITDWVYEEEFGFVRAFDWSPDSSEIVYMRFDESKVPIFSMDIYGKDVYQFPYQFRYPKAGEENSEVTLHRFTIESRKKDKINFEGERPYYIPRISYAKGANGLIIQTLNRHQNDLKVWRWNSKENTLQLILEEKEETYVSNHDNLKFLEDGSFLWTSEKDGHNHIYHHNENGVLIRQITKGNWEVTSLYDYNPKSKEIYYQSVEGSSTERGLFAIKLSGKGKRTLQPTEGTNGATFSVGGAYYIHSYSDEKTPPIYTLYNTQENTPLFRILENEDLTKTLATFGFSDKEFSTIEVNGESLNMWMIKPADFDASKQYPVLMFQYSGPGSQQVANRWGDQRALWHKYLANQGYIIACVDGRGTGFKGADFKKVTYLNLVKYEALDQIAAAKKLGALPFVDANRIGIWGWSFGGHMAAHCLLTGNDVFSFGIAVAPVTNWRFYDTIYTERFMRTPQENPEGYDLNSPLNYADQLKGKFLIIHGSGDDNVHVQNTMRMVEELIQADKQFEWMIYPDKNHGIYGGNTRKHLYSKMTNFILENL
jgi:dipeptidyl-peptidase 4|tara:strand:+ start:10253 stop:12406 length:2154 start_codon:yes stop_codon:yes gene_type:complete